jgi:Flp pilus assembly protein TadG
MIRLTKRPERGAALVEMAMVLPLFLLLIFGVMEASWAFAQLNDAHHGVREGARLAAVDFDSDDDPSTPEDLLLEMCNRMNLAGGPNATVTLTASDTNGDGSIGRGDTGNSAVSVSYQSITGVVDFAFGGKTLASDANFLLEQPLDDAGVTWIGSMSCS